MKHDLLTDTQYKIHNYVFTRYIKTWFDSNSQALNSSNYRFNTNPIDISKKNEMKTFIKQHNKFFLAFNKILQN